MSIHTITMYSAKCDNCQETFEHYHTGYTAFADKESCRDAMVNESSSGWIEHKINESVKHYCSKCFQFDDNDKLMLNSQRKVEPKIYSRDECVFNYCPSPELCKEKNACCNG
jgi:hypothetical protein